MVRASRRQEAAGGNRETDFHGQKRGNETHASTTDPDARLYRKGPGKEAKLCFMGHALMENRKGLSGVLCVRLISSLSDEPFAEDDGELGLGLEPLTRRPLPFPAALLRTKYSSLMAASSFGKWPRVRTARRSLEFSASIAFVV
jgi:hypothetical protein